MKYNSIFKGSAVALVTPFDKKGNVNYYALKKLIEFQIASGTKAIVILGTTGEASTLTSEEKAKIIRFSVAEISGRVPLIVGTGSNSTETAISQSIEAEQFGADALLVVTPYYNKCNQNGLYKHFKAVAKSVSIPIILYNVPSRTGVNIESETVCKLSKIKNIVGIKESSLNIANALELIHILPNSFSVYSGDDLTAMPLISAGASGVISVTANVYPELVSNMCEFALSRDMFNAKRLHNFLFDINKGLFLDVNPIPVKAYLNMIGHSVGEPRLPLSTLEYNDLLKLRQLKDKYEN